jgi:hypothetical protein
MTRFPHLFWLLTGELPNPSLVAEGTRGHVSSLDANLAGASAPVPFPKGFLGALCDRADRSQRKGSRHAR